MRKRIPNYENYEVDSDGYVVNINTKRKLKVDIGKKGYHRIPLCKNNKSVKFLLYRLVAEAFIPNPFNLPTVNHKLTKDDNDYLSLEWMSQEDNQRHAVLNGLCPKGSGNGNSKWKEDRIHRVCALIQEGHIRSYVLNLTSVTKSTFDDIRRRKTWRHISINYIW